MIMENEKWRIDIAKRMEEWQALCRATFHNALCQMLHQFILNAPAVDAVEVVRCKDCKHSGMYCFGTRPEPTFACLEIEEDGFVSMATAADPEGYCSKGEKRNGD